MEQEAVGQIRLFGGDFAPRNWAFCEGQPTPISRYPVLYSLIGTAYGGDGIQYFALPDLRGKGPKSATNAKGYLRYIICIDGEYISRP